MNTISSVNFNSGSNFQSFLGTGNRINATALTDNNRSPFGALDIDMLASGLIEAATTGNLPEGLVETVMQMLSPVEIGQLLAAIEKLLSGNADGSGGAAPVPQSTGNDGSVSDCMPAVSTPSTPRASAPATSAPGTTQGTPIEAMSENRITTRAPDSINLPDVEAIANNPAVAAAIEKAWNASNPNTPGAKQEQGFWVMRDDKSGALSTVNFPSNGTRDSLTPGAVPAIEGKSMVAFFHTHPNTTAEGYTNGPSTADQNFADRLGIPGIVQSHNGLYFFD